VSSSIEARAEVLKLARLLQREPDSLAYLEGVPPADLRELRDQVTERLFSAHGKTLARLAAASRVLPTGLLATIGERAFGPLLCARVAGRLEPARAVDVAAKLSPAFLADVAVDLDPRRASDVIGRIPPAQVAAVAHELVARGEYVTLGRFVGHIGDDSLRAAVDEMDDSVLVQVAFVLEDKSHVDELANIVGEDRLLSMMRVAADDELWSEGLDLLAGLSPERRAALVARLTPAERSTLTERAREAGVLDRVRTSSTS
jgi:hypothetical protein